MANIVLILDNIRSTHNVGSILRTADGFGVTTILFCGYTPYPQIADDPRLPHEYAKITRAIHKTALGAETTMQSKIFVSTKTAIEYVKKLNYTVIALEQANSSIALADYPPATSMAIILGNEVDGIASNTLSLCDVILEIPMFGNKESFNVSISSAICLYELTRGKK